MVQVYSYTKLLIGTELDISGNADVDGTANLDVVDIDGAVDMASTLQVDGAITSGSSTVVATSLQQLIPFFSADTYYLVLTTDADAQMTQS